MPGRLLSYATVARLLDCSEKTVRRLVEKGLLSPPLAYEGVGARFTRDDVLLYMASRRRPVKRKTKGQDGTGRDK
jgi:excisionase family DNA binding protein